MLTVYIDYGGGSLCMMLLLHELYVACSHVNKQMVNVGEPQIPLYASGQ